MPIDMPEEVRESFAREALRFKALVGLYKAQHNEAAGGICHCDICDRTNLPPDAKLSIAEFDHLFPPGGQASWRK